MSHSVENYQCCLWNMWNRSVSPVLRTEHLSPHAAAEALIHCKYMMKLVFQLQAAVRDLLTSETPEEESWWIYCFLRMFPDFFFPPPEDTCDGPGRRLPVFPVEAQKPSQALTGVVSCVSRDLQFQLWPPLHFRFNGAKSEAKTAAFLLVVALEERSWDLFRGAERDQDYKTLMTRPSASPQMRLKQ